MILRVPQVKSRQLDNMPRKPRTTSIHATAKFLKEMKLLQAQNFSGILIHSNVDKNSTVNERMEFPRAYVLLLRSLGNQNIKQ